MSDRPDQIAARSQRFDPIGRRSFYRVVGFILVVFVAAMAIEGWRIYDMRHRVVGDGENVESYGYDLSGLAVDPNLLVASGIVKDGQPAMVDPPHHSAETVAELNEVSATDYRRAVVAREMVVGVAIDGDACAYPVRYLNVHEIVNDTIGGVPVAVTFSPISRAAVVVDRRVDGEVLTFGYSGLLYNHNLVMYDHQNDPNDQSLWSQLKFEAIAGPRKGTKLQVLPMRLTRWDQWVAAHPDSRLLEGDRRYTKRYKNAPYDDQFRSGEPVLPVEPLPPGDAGLECAAMVAAFKSDRGWTVVPEPFVQRQRIPDAAPVAYARWFAWYAMHGEPTDVLGLDLPAARRELMGVEPNAVTD